MPSKVGQERGANGMTEQRTSRHDVYRIPRTEEHEDDLAEKKRPGISRRALAIGGTATAIVALGAGLATGLMRGNNASAEGPAKANRPTASAPAVPGEQSPSTAASSAETAGNYTDETLPFYAADGKKFVGLQAYEQALGVPYDSNKMTGSNANPKEYSEAAVTQVLDDMLNAAKQSYDPRYGEIGPGTAQSSRLYKEAALGPELVDPAYQGSVAEFYDTVALPGLSGNGVTDYKVYPHYAISGQNELTGQGMAVLTADRVDVTTNSGTTSYFLQVTLTNESTPTGEKLVVSGWEQNTLADAQNNANYDQSMLPTS